MSDLAGNISGKKPASRIFFHNIIFFNNPQGFIDGFKFTSIDIVGGMRVSQPRVRTNSSRKSVSESDYSEEKSDDSIVLSQSEAENQQIVKDLLEKDMSSDPIRSFHTKPMPTHEMNHNKPRAAQHKNLFQPRKQAKRIPIIYIYRER